MTPVRILLHNVVTQLYCREDSDWTADRDLALAFPTSAQALQFVHQHQIKDLEFVFTFGEPAYDLSTPIQKGLL